MRQRLRQICQHDAPEQAEFLKNAERWSQMSPAERQAWRDLVANVPQWPPLPIGFVDADSRRTPCRPSPRITIEQREFQFPFPPRALISTVHPIAFHLGSFTVHSYGVMIALAFLSGLWTATLRARREKISGEIIADVTLWLMVGAILGARIVYVTTYWKEEFAGQPFRKSSPSGMADWFITAA